MCLFYTESINNFVSSLLTNKEISQQERKPRKLVNNLQTELHWGSGSAGGLEILRSPKIRRRALFSHYERHDGIVNVIFLRGPEM